MKRLDLPLILDVLFYSFCTFLISVGLLRYGRAPTGIAISVSVLLAAAAGAGCFLLIYLRHRKHSLSRAERERKEKLLLHLALEREERLNKQLLAAFTADGRGAIEQNGIISVDGEANIPLFTMQPVSADAVAKLIRSYGEIPFTLLVNELTPEAERLLLSFGRKAVRGDEIFDLFERTATTPEKLICGEIPRPRARAKFRRIFAKRNARPFFVSGALLLLMSFFTFFPVYYIISGSILLFAAMAVRLLGTV